MKEIDKLEYEQASEDWRHRDHLTWQIPAVLVVVGGLLVAEAYKLPYGVPTWVKIALLLLAFGLSLSLTLALIHNLLVQKQDKEIIKEINPQTRRFCFRKVGSYALSILSVGISIFLLVVCYMSICSTF